MLTLLTNTGLSCMIRRLTCVIVTLKIELRANSLISRVVLDLSCVIRRLNFVVVKFKNRI